MEDLRKSIVYIGKPDESYRKFFPVGTGFVIQNKNEKLIVTSAHLLDPDYGAFRPDNKTVNFVLAWDFQKEDYQSLQKSIPATVLPDKLDVDKGDLVVLRPLLGNNQSTLEKWNEIKSLEPKYLQDHQHEKITVIGYRSDGSSDKNNLQFVDCILRGRDHLNAEFKQLNIDNPEGELANGFSGSPIIHNGQCIGIYTGSSRFNENSNARPANLRNRSKITIDSPDFKGVCISELLNLLGHKIVDDSSNFQYPESILGNLEREPNLKDRFHTIRLSPDKDTFQFSKYVIRLRNYWGLNRGAFLGMCCGAEGLYKSLLKVEQEIKLSGISQNFMTRWWLRINAEEMDLDYFGKVENLLGRDNFFNQEIKKNKGQLPPNVKVGLLVEGRPSSPSKIIDFYQWVSDKLGPERPLAMIIGLKNSNPEDKIFIKNTFNKLSNSFFFRSFPSTELDFFLPFENIPSYKITPTSILFPKNKMEYIYSLICHIADRHNHEILVEFPQLLHLWTITHKKRKSEESEDLLEMEAIKMEEIVSEMDNYASKFSKAESLDKELLEFIEKYNKENLFELVVKYSDSNRTAARGLALQYSTRFRGLTEQCFSYIIEHNLYLPHPDELKVFGPKEHINYIFSALLKLSHPPVNYEKLKAILQNFESLIDAKSDLKKLFDLALKTNGDFKFFRGLKSEYCKIATLGEVKLLGSKMLGDFLRFLDNNPYLFPLILQNDISILPLLEMPISVRKYFGFLTPKEEKSYWPGKEDEDIKSTRKKLISHYEF